MEIATSRNGQFNEIEFIGGDELVNAWGGNAASYLRNFFVNGVPESVGGEKVCVNLENIEYIDSDVYAALGTLTNMSQRFGYGKVRLKGVHGAVERLLDMDVENYRKFKFV